MFNLFKFKKENILSDFAQFVGFFTAHAVWQIEEGDNVVPLIAFQKSKEKKIERFADDSYEDALKEARKRQKELMKESDYCLLAFDSFLTLQEKKYEAIFIEASDSKNNFNVQFAIPYRSSKSKEGLAIYRPKVLTSLDNPEAFFKEFYKGVESHQKAAQFWNTYLDQSK